MQASVSHHVRVSYEFPWRFAEVCRYWRDVVVGIPEFWTTISIESLGVMPPFRTFTMEQEDLEAHRCELQLERSKALPLTIRAQTFFSHSALDTIILQQDRWKDVELRMPLLVFICFFVKAVRVTKPTNLERLLVSLYDPRSWVPDDTSPEFLPVDFVTALELANSKPETKDVEFPRDIECSCARMQDLTLTTPRFDIYDLSHTLYQCSTLKRLTLGGRGTTDTREDAPPEAAPTYASIEMPMLQYLKYDVTASCNYPSMIKAPVLEELHIGNTFPTLSLAVFTKHSASRIKRIKRLTMEQFAMKDESDARRLVRSLSRLNALESLSVHFILGDEELEDDQTERLWSFQSMDYRVMLLTFQEKAPYCPQLTTLELTGASCSDDTYLIFMLESRNPAVSVRMPQSPTRKFPDKFLDDVSVELWPVSVADVFSERDHERMKELSSGMRRFRLEDMENDDEDDASPDEDDWNTDGSKEEDLDSEATDSST